VTDPAARKGPYRFVFTTAGDLTVVDGTLKTIWRVDTGDAHPVRSAVLSRFPGDEGEDSGILAAIGMGIMGALESYIDTLVNGRNPSKANLMTRTARMPSFSSGFFGVYGTVPPLPRDMTTARDMVRSSDPDLIWSTGTRWRSCLEVQDGSVDLELNDEAKASSFFGCSVDNPGGQWHMTFRARGDDPFSLPCD